MKIAVVIPTYKRLDKSTPKHLKKALGSVVNQTHKDWKIFLIGDNYEQPSEVLELIKDIPKEKIVFHNLVKAMERDEKYPSEMLWKYGGVNAVNTGISTALTEGYDWIAHLDHDDAWYDNHLEEIAKAIKITGNQTAWICTVSEYLTDTSFLPVIFDWRDLVEFEPIPQGLIHSSVCMNFHRMPLKYIDLYKDNKKNPNSEWLPADAELWKRCAEFLKINDLKSYCVNKVTCSHLEEGYELKKS